MTRDELDKSINFRTIDAPCCGNCKRFLRVWEDTECTHPKNVWKYKEPEYSEDDNPLRYIWEHDVCDRFERKETVK